MVVAYPQPISNPRTHSLLIPKKIIRVELPPEVEPPGGVGAGGDGKLEWGFGNPSENNNPGLYQGLPDSARKRLQFWRRRNWKRRSRFCGRNPLEIPSCPEAEMLLQMCGPDGAKTGSTGNGFWELAIAHSPPSLCSLMVNCLEVRAALKFQTKKTKIPNEPLHLQRIKPVLKQQQRWLISRL
jgi:hypothetical protein